MVNEGTPWDEVIGVVKDGNFLSLFDWYQELMVLIA